MRLAFAAMLSLPIVPMCWVAGTGRYMGNGSSACAILGVSCNVCTPDTCGALDYYQSIHWVNSVYLYRCIDFDASPPGHCATVLRNTYDKVYANRAGDYKDLGYCVKEECNSSMIRMDSPCDNPYYVHGTTGGTGDPGGGGF